MKRTSETLVGSIERVTYHNADNGFGVLKIVVKGVLVRRMLRAQMAVLAEPGRLLLGFSRFRSATKIKAART